MTMWQGSEEIVELARKLAWALTPKPTAVKIALKVKKEVEKEFFSDDEDNDKTNFVATLKNHGVCY